RLAAHGRGAAANVRRFSQQHRATLRLAARLPLLAILLLALLLPGTGALAQSVSIDLGAAGQPGATARLVQLVALIGLLSIAPSLMVMATAFARIVIVLSLL